MENKNEMVLFHNEEFGNVRVVNIGDEAWLAGKDVVEALGYNKKYSDVIKQHCDEEDYIFVDGKTRHQFGVEFNYKELGQRGGYLVNESGLYALVFESELKEARKFRRWVTSEVLPQIRQTGGYIPIVEEDDDATIMAKALLVAQKTIDKKQEIIDRQQKLIESQRPKVEFADAVSESEDEIDVETMAKLLAKEDIKIGRNRLFDILKTLNILMKTNLPYQRFLDSGYFRVIECKKYNKYDNKPRLYKKTLITGKGQLYITKKVKEYFKNNNK